MSALRYHMPAESGRRGLFFFLFFLFFLFTTALSTSLSRPAVGAVFTVGAEGAPACTSTSLSAAIQMAADNGPSADTIRVARNQSYTGELSIVAQSLTIEGGYDNCSDTTPSGVTVITRPFNHRAVSISGSANGARGVVLASLDIRFDGMSSAVQDEGGAIRVADGHSLALRGTNVQGGAAAHGGGIFVGGSGSILYLQNSSSVLFNGATLDGGGIACDGGVVFLQSGIVAYNAADNGAGVHLDGGCTLFSYIGGFLEGIRMNTAYGDGGGIYATAGSKVHLAGGSSHPAVVDGNAAVRGGGIFATGWLTEVLPTDTHISSNTASAGGGGIYLEGQASLVMERVSGSSCHDPVRCSRLDSNDSTGWPGGGALYVDTGALATVRQTYIENNTSEFGAVAWVGGGAGGSLLLEGDVITGNQGNDLVQLWDNSFLEARFTTAANNVPPDPLASVAFYANGTDTAQAFLLSSIIWEPQGQVYGGGIAGASHEYDCLMVISTFGIETGTRLSTSNPMFVDPAGGDYHLKPASPAIDYCDGAEFVHEVLDGDIDGETWGFDHPDVGNLFGPFDIGADEVHQDLFSDGFESGDTSAWSNVEP